MVSFPKRSRKIALIEGAIAGTLFGFAAIFIRLLYSLNVFSIALGRLLIASATLVLIIVVLKQPFDLSLIKKNIGWLSLLGALVGIHFILFISAVNDTTILNATVLVNTSPILAMIVSVFLFQIKPTRLALMGLIVSFIGIFTIVYGDAVGAFTINLRGDLEAILASLSEAFYLNYGREIRGKMSILSMMIPLYAISAFIIGFFSILIGAQLTFPNQLSLVFLLIGLGVIPTALGHTFYFSSLSNLKSFETATLALLEPIGATVIGIALFGEIPSVTFLFGASLVLGGIVLVLKERPFRIV